MSKSVFIQELVREGDRWRMSIGEVGSTWALWHEMYPPGHMAPYGVTIEEEMIQYEPVIGHFFIAGITEEAVAAMEPGFAEAFRSAGFTPGPAPGRLRTWMPGVEQPFDVTEEEYAELYFDNFTGVDMPHLAEMTIWDPLATQDLDFRYANGKTFRTRVGDIQQSQAAGDFLWNDSNYLIVPVDPSWQPVITARTAPRMFQLRVQLEAADAKVRAEQLEIGEAIGIFVQILNLYGQIPQ